MRSRFRLLAAALTPLAVALASCVTLSDAVARRPLGEGGPILLSASALAKQLDDGSYALISAGRNTDDPADAALPQDAVDGRHRAMGEELRADGYRYVELEGHYGGATEASYMVFSKIAERPKFLEMGARYNQGSVILAAGGTQELIFTNGKNKGRFHRGTGWQRLADATSDYSVAPTSDGGRLLFRLDFDFAQLLGERVRLDSPRRPVVARSSPSRPVIPSRTQ
jgi:hypothetical protein